MRIIAARAGWREALWQRTRRSPSRRSRRTPGFRPPPSHARSTTPSSWARRHSSASANPCARWGTGATCAPPLGSTAPRSSSSTFPGSTTRSTPRSCAASAWRPRCARPSWWCGGARPTPRTSRDSATRSIAAQPMASSRWRRSRSRRSSRSSARRRWCSAPSATWTPGSPT